MDMDAGTAADVVGVVVRCCTRTGVAGVMKDNRVSFPRCAMTGE